MKNPALYLKQAVYTAINVPSVTTVEGESVTVYTDAPKEPPSNFVWSAVIGYEDVGTKDKFIGSVNYEVTVVTKTNIAAPSSLLCEQITNEVTQLLVYRGTGLTDGEGIFSFFSVICEGIDGNSSLIDNKQEIYNKIQLRVLCEEL